MNAPSQPDEMGELLQRAQHGDAHAVNELFTRFRDRLHRMVRARMDTHVQARINASDVVQEAYLDAFKRLDEYLANPRLPWFLWLRLLVGERLAKLHRFHLGAQKRSVYREEEDRLPLVHASSMLLAEDLVADIAPPSQIVDRAEQVQLLEKAIGTLSEQDREILTLRHYEQLTRSECALVLGIEEGAAAKRYIRALRRLKDKVRPPHSPSDPSSEGEQS